MATSPPTWRRTWIKSAAPGRIFLQTQPVFDLKGFDAWWRAMAALGLHEKMKILPGVLVPKSSRALEFMKGHVPGILIPDEHIRRMQQAAQPEAEGHRLALEIVDALLQYPIAGLHIYPVFQEPYVPEFAAEVRRRAAAAGKDVTLAEPTLVS